MFKQTALTSLDSYKLGHADQYPEGITKVYSNFTARSEKHFGVPDQYKSNKIVWFGLQGFLLELCVIWSDTFFNRWFPDVLAEAQEMYGPFCGPNGFDFNRLADLHNLGYLPLEIKALPEGSRVNIGVPVLTITNTDPEFFWLPNFLETWISSELWKSSTSATSSYVVREIIDKYAKITGANREFSMWQGHDFSVRGMSGIADSAKSGAGHLLSFTGTDNLPAVKYINDCYSGKETFIGGSVPATEHSVMCAGGKESELETFRRLITKYPKGIVSIVSDTWDFWKVIGGPESIAAKLKCEIEARTTDQFGNAKVVFRPDSGDPVKIICGYRVYDLDELEDAMPAAYDADFYDAVHREGSYYEIASTPNGYEIVRELSKYEVKGAVQCLWDTFGGTHNMQGYKTLSQKVGLIYGDSITAERAEQILQQLADKSFTSDNIVFGIGSYTFQYQTRDTFGFAMKATYVEINGVGQAIFKDPVTDNGTKKSAKGLLHVSSNVNGFVLMDNVSKEVADTGELRTVFKNGEILRFESFADIRSRLGSI